jgi:hypothetical protein
LAPQKEIVLVQGLAWESVRVLVEELAEVSVAVLDLELDQMWEEKLASRLSVLWLGLELDQELE